MSPVFQRVDKRFIAQVVADGMTHGEQTLYESSLDFDSDGQGTRAERATALISYLFGVDGGADAAILELLNYLYVDSARAGWRRDSPSFAALKKSVLEPRGVSLTDGGFAIQGSAPPQAKVAAQVRPQPTAPVQWAAKGSFVSPGSGLPSSTRSQRPVTVSRPGADSQSVFVVHGRDQRPVDVLEQFLVYVGLRLMRWSDARERTGQPQPTTYDIVKAGMDSAAAIVVIFSPDDEARLKPALHSDGEEQERASGQPRQNVLLEAGMAFAAAPQRTIFVQSARTRPITDISGFNWVKLDGAWDSREDLVKRLRHAGAAVNAPANLLASLAGPFCVT